MRSCLKALRIALGCCWLGASSLSIPSAWAAPAEENIDVPAHAFSRQSAWPSWAEWVDAPSAPDNRGPMIVRLGHTQIRLEEGSTDILVHRAWQANDQSALGTLGQYSVSFQPDYQQLVLRRLAVLRQGQRIDKLAQAQVRFVRPQQDNDNLTISGWLTAIVVVDDIRVGDTLDIAYSLLGQNPVFNGRFFDSAEWDLPYPVVRRIVSLDAPAQRAIHYRMLGPATAQPVQPIERTANGRRTLRLEASNLPEVPLDEFIPADVDVLRAIQWSEFSQWSEVVDWALPLFAVPTGADAGIDALVAKVRKAGTPRQQVMAALESVQDDIRYLAQPFGENSHRPAPPAEVLARRFGDCKDKTLLLVTVLRRLGIDAVPALLSTQNRRGLAKLLPSPLDFDHVIARVRLADGEYFIDPTLRRQTGDLDRIGRPHVDTDVLLIAPGERALRRTAAAPAALTTDTRTEQITVTAFDAPVRMHVRIDFAGQGAESVRRAMTSVSPEQWRKFYEGDLDRRYRQARLLDAPQIKDNPRANTASIDLDYEITDFFEGSKDQRIARYAANNMRGLFNIPNSARRSAPLAVPGYPSTTRYVIEITLPDTVDSRRRPTDNTVSSTAFSATSALTQTGRSARAQIDLTIKSDRVEPADMSAFLEAIRNLNDMVAGGFVFDEGDMRRAPAQRADLSYKEGVRRHLSQTAADASSTLAKPGINALDRATALCGRAMAEAYLGQTTTATRDRDEALRQAPDDAAIQGCAGAVDFAMGALQTSIDGFTRALATNASDADLYWRRGLARYLNGDLPRALTDFTQARTLSTDARGRGRAEAWRQLSLLRLGLPADTTTVQTDWPAPIVGMILGQQSPDQVSQALYARFSGDVLETMLAETYFYAAAYHSALGHASLAAAFYERALDKGMINSPLHTAALRERARLTATTPR
ncbi:MAG: DUF3857 domain-containing protein [Rhodocyclaceae bacterium]